MMYTHAPFLRLLEPIESVVGLSTVDSVCYQLTHTNCRYFHCIEYTGKKRMVINLGPQGHEVCHMGLDSLSRVVELDVGASRKWRNWELVALALVYRLSCSESFPTMTSRFSSFVLMGSGRSSLWGSARNFEVSWHFDSNESYASCLFM